MPEQIIYPPIKYIFYLSEQGSEQAWSAISSFAEAWNQTHSNQFSGTGEKWNLTLEKGIRDPDYPVIEDDLQDLKKTHDIEWFVGVTDKRKPADFETAPYVRIVGNSYPTGFVSNLEDALGPPFQCPECGLEQSRSRPVKAPLIIDESFLDIKMSSSGDYDPPGLDLVTIADSMLLVSSRFADIFKARRVQGYELEKVLTKSTGAASEKMFLLRATVVVLKPCNVHTPSTKEGICATCGRILGGLLGNYYVRDEWLNGAEVFSGDVLKYRLIYVSNRLYATMKQQKIKGLLPAAGIFSCTHKTN